MPLYKIIKLWLIPPGIIVTIFIILSIYLYLCSLYTKKCDNGNNYNKICKILNIGAFCCLFFSFVIYAISINAVSQRFMHSLEYKYFRTECNADAILLLGGSGNTRIRVAARLQKKYNIDIIASGYKGETINMKKSLIELKVPDAQIILEPKSANTKDHVQYILPILLNKQYKKVFIVTDAFHMPRSMMNFYKTYQEYGIEVIPYSAQCTVPLEHKPNLYEWIPNVWSFEQSAKAWHEYLGMLEVWISRLL